MIDSVLFFSKCYDFFTRRNTSRFTKLSGKQLALIHVYNSLCIATFAYILCESFYSIEWPCFSINDCAVWLLSWNHVSVAIIILTSSATYRRTKTIRCFNQAGLLVKKCCQRMHRKSMQQVVYYFGTATTVFAMKTVTSLLHNKDINPVVFLVYSTSYLVPLAMESLVICMCCVVKDTAEKIDQILYALSVQEYSYVLLALNLKKLMKIHQESCNFLRTVTKCFDKDLLIDLTFNMVWFVIYIYIITVSLWRFDSQEGEFWKVWSVILEVLFLTFRVCYLSYSVNCIDLQAQKMLSRLRTFQESKKLDHLCSKLTTQFLYQITDNETKMQICGCFYVDLSFMRGVIGLATTYLVVFIQYGLGDQSSSKVVVNATAA